MKDYQKKINFTVIAILTFVLFILLNYLSSRHYKRFDLTKTNIYSLSDQSKAILKRVNTNLNIYVFLPEKIQMFEYIQELIKNYAQLNSNIKIEYIDPLKDKLKAQQLAQKYNLNSADVIIFEYNNNYKFVNYDELFDYDMDYSNRGRRAPKVSNFKGEQKFSSIILSLIENRKSIIYYTVGHNELPFDYQQTNNDAEKKNLAFFKQEIIEKNNFELKELSANFNKIPNDCAILLIAAPQFDFNDLEISSLKNYIANGGRLFVLLEPSLAKKDSPLNKLIGLLKEVNINFQNVLVIDKSNMLPLFGAGAIIAESIGNNEITDNLVKYKLPVFLNICAAFEITQTNDKKNAITTQALLTTSPNAFAKTDLTNLKKIEFNQAQDKSGIMNLAVLSTGKLIEKNANTIIKQDTDTALTTDTANLAANQTQPSEFKIVAIADADLFSENLAQNAGNYTLAGNIINYLADKKDLISVPPKSPEKTQLTLSNSDMSSIFMFTVVILPIFAVISGIIVWRRRRA